MGLAAKLRASRILHCTADAIYQAMSTAWTDKVKVVWFKGEKFLGNMLMKGPLHSLHTFLPAFFSEASLQNLLLLLELPADEFKLLAEFALSECAIKHVAVLRFRARFSFSVLIQVASPMVKLYRTPVYDTVSSPVLYRLLLHTVVRSP